MMCLKLYKSYLKNMQCYVHFFCRAEFSFCFCKRSLSKVFNCVKNCSPNRERASTPVQYIQIIFFTTECKFSCLFSVVKTNTQCRGVTALQLMPMHSLLILLRIAWPQLCMWVVPCGYFVSTAAVDDEDACLCRSHSTPLNCMQNHVSGQYCER